VTTDALDTRLGMGGPLPLMNGSVMTILTLGRIDFQLHHAFLRMIFHIGPMTRFTRHTGVGVSTLDRIEIRGVTTQAFTLTQGHTLTTGYIQRCLDIDHRFGVWRKPPSLSFRRMTSHTFDRVLRTWIGLCCQRHPWKQQTA
jgi:hypothetical protein